MSTVAVAAPTSRRAPAEPLAGTGVVLRFALRRNRARLAVWWLVEVGMLAYITALYKQQFSDPANRESFLRITKDQSMTALVGHLSNPGSLGSAVWLKGWMFLSVMLAVGMVFLVTHNLRGDEEAGRIELFRAGRLGLHAEMAATAVITLTLCLAVAVGSFAVLAALGIGIRESALFAVSVGAVGALGVGVGLVTNQVAPTGRGANGVGSAVIMVFYALRVIGDTQKNGLTWASPIGWGQKTDPWGANRWWPLLLLVVLVALCAAAAWALEARRDHGAGLVAPRKGTATASRGLTTVTGLSFRLQRGALVGWAVGLVLAGALIGSVIKQMLDLVKNMTLGVLGSHDTGTIIALLVSMIALVVAMAGVQSASHLRGDEATGTLESQLAGAVTRLGWALRRLAVTFAAVVVLLVLTGATMGAVYGQSVGDASQTGRLTVAMLAYLPACAIMIGVVVLGLGWWPRVGSSIAWGLIGLMYFLVLFGTDLKLPSWAMSAIPFTGTPRLPADAMSWPPVVVMSLVAVAMTAVGLFGFRRRDIPA